MYVKTKNYKSENTPVKYYEKFSQLFPSRVSKIHFKFGVL